MDIFIDHIGFTSAHCISHYILPFLIHMPWSVGRIFHLSCFCITQTTDWLWLSEAVVVAKLMVPQPSGHLSVEHKSRKANYTEARIDFNLFPHETWGLSLVELRFFFPLKAFKEQQQILRIYENYGPFTQGCELRQTSSPGHRAKVSIQQRLSLVIIVFTLFDVILKSHVSCKRLFKQLEVTECLAGMSFSSKAHQIKCTGIPHPVGKWHIMRWGGGIVWFLFISPDRINEAGDIPTIWIKFLAWLSWGPRRKQITISCPIHFRVIHDDVGPEISSSGKNSAKDENLFPQSVVWLGRIALILCNFEGLRQVRDRNVIPPLSSQARPSPLTAHFFRSS